MDVLTLIIATHSYELPADTDTRALGSELAAAAQSGGGMVNVVTTSTRGLSVLITPGLFVAIELKKLGNAEPFFRTTSTGRMRRTTFNTTNCRPMWPSGLCSPVKDSLLGFKNGGPAAKKGDPRDITITHIRG
jgi:hypothetical protein